MTRIGPDVLEGAAVDVAPLLLGAVLRSDLGDSSIAVRITEVEAYAGADDPASHAFRGLTRRTAVMFGPAGRLYCYFVYGMHWCANIVTGPDGSPGAVLLRAGAIIDGPAVGATRQHASASASADKVASGPARLARTLGLSGSDNGVDLRAPSSPVRLEYLGPPTEHLSGPRVGVSVGADRAWRFWLPEEPSVSRYRAAVRRARPATRQTGVS